MQRLADHNSSSLSPVLLDNGKVLCLPPSAMPGGKASGMIYICLACQPHLPESRSVMLIMQLFFLSRIDRRRTFLPSWRFLLETKQASTT